MLQWILNVGCFCRDLGLLVNESQNCTYTVPPIIQVNNGGDIFLLGSSLIICNVFQFLDNYSPRHQVMGRLKGGVSIFLHAP